MPPRPAPLTLIVATTPIPTTPTPSTTTTTTTTGRTNAPLRLGIGLNGTLPWPRIKTDMTFFARTTSRPPTSAPASSTNAILMGRKTYDSIPAALRPLGKRINAVITRSVDDVARRVQQDLDAKRRKDEEKLRAATQGQGQGQTETPQGPQTDAIVCAGLEESLTTLEARYGAEDRLGRLFVIGGAEIYGAALRVTTRGVRIVMTFVEKVAFQEDRGQVFECDTFFPLDEELLQEKGWRRVSAREVSEWVGETVTDEWIVEGEVRVRMVGYERVD
ncbi:dihydrofolate reductase [Aspergillus violaceofuscus CBS 115571]|uniref:Dihydrofolate reductase n=1 Tax=Aspergillus violaceofuscus (strain CBS 115571) TaxID=1450538 RepID=A0A2V5GZ53_ASPV1|nr:dihydrofolate reductase [Aspergillus violaceofuscus CBS 115571]